MKSLRLMFINLAARLSSAFSSGVKRTVHSLENIRPFSLLLGFFIAGPFNIQENRWSEGNPDLLLLTPICKDWVSRGKDRGHTSHPCSPPFGSPEA